MMVLKLDGIRGPTQGVPAGSFCRINRVKLEVTSVGMSYLCFTRRF